MLRYEWIKTVLGEGKQASQIKQETVWCTGKPGGLWMGKCGQDWNFLRGVCLSVTVTVEKKKILLSHKLYKDDILRLKSAYNFSQKYVHVYKYVY